MTDRLRSSRCLPSCFSRLFKIFIPNHNYPTTKYNYHTNCPTSSSTSNGDGKNTNNNHQVDDNNWVIDEEVDADGLGSTFCLMQSSSKTHKYTYTQGDANTDTTVTNSSNNNNNKTSKRAPKLSRRVYVSTSFSPCDVALLLSMTKITTSLVRKSLDYQHMKVS